MAEAVKVGTEFLVNPQTAGDQAYLGSASWR
jgi:hypothetical protein